MLNDAELMKQRRIQTLKNSILAQLGVTDPGETTEDEPLPGEEAMKETFNALRSASASLEREKERRCHSEDFYAKPVSSFVGIMSEGTNLPRVVLAILFLECPDVSYGITCLVYSTVEHIIDSADFKCIEACVHICACLNCYISQYPKDLDVGKGIVFVHNMPQGQWGDDHTVHS